MKRKLAPAAALLAAALLGLTGCHGQREQAAFTVPAQFDESRDYEITFWAKNDTNMAQTNIYKQAIEDFQALYPNITVTLRLYTDYGDIYNDVITNIATATTPNVCITYPDHIATYLTGDNVVVPLDDLLADEAYGPGGSELRFDGPARDEIVPQFLEEGRLNGHYYALPYMRSTEACYVNQTMVEQLGYTLPDVLTWDFIWEVSEAAAATKGADGVFAANGQKVLLPFIYKSTDNMMIQMLRQLDAGYSSAAGDIQLFNDTTAQLLHGIAAHTASGAFSTFKISGYPANFLNAGQCIFAVDSTAGATWTGQRRAACRHRPRRDRPVLRPPCARSRRFDPEHPQMISQGPSVCIFNKDDRRRCWPPGCLHNICSQTMCRSPIPDRRLCAGDGQGPDDPVYQDYLSRAGADDDEHYRVKIEAAQLLLDNLENTFITPVFNGSASLRDAAGQLIEDVDQGGAPQGRRWTTPSSNSFTPTPRRCTTWAAAPRRATKRTWARCPPRPGCCWAPLAAAWLASGCMCASVGKSSKTVTKARKNGANG